MCDVCEKYFLVVEVIFFFLLCIHCIFLFELLFSYCYCRCFSSTTCTHVCSTTAAAVTDFFLVQSEVSSVFCFCFLLLFLPPFLSSSLFLFCFVFVILFNYFAHVLFPLFAVQQAGFVPPAPGHTSEHSSIITVILPLSVVINNSFEYGQIEPVDGI